VRLLQVGKEYRAAGCGPGINIPWKISLRCHYESRSLEYQVDHKGRGYVARMPLNTITGFVNGSVVTEIGAQPSPFLVVDVDTRPEFYKSTPQGGYVECEDFTLREASTYARHFLLLHSTEEEAYSWVDKLMIFESQMRTVAANTEWAATDQMDMLLPMVLPEDPEHMSYMTREELEAELMQHRRKKARITGAPLPKPPGAVYPRGMPNRPTTPHSPGGALAPPTMMEALAGSPVAPRPLSPTAQPGASLPATPPVFGRGIPGQAPSGIPGQAPSGIPGPPSGGNLHNPITAMSGAPQATATAKVV